MLLDDYQPWVVNLVLSFSFPFFSMPSLVNAPDSTAGKWHYLKCALGFSHALQSNGSYAITRNIIRKGRTNGTDIDEKKS